MNEVTIHVRMDATEAEATMGSLKEESDRFGNDIGQNLETKLSDAGDKAGQDLGRSVDDAAARETTRLGDDVLGDFGKDADTIGRDTGTELGEAASSAAKDSASGGGMGMASMLAGGLLLGGPLVSAAMAGVAVVGLVALGAVIEKGSPQIQTSWSALTSSLGDEAKQAAGSMVVPISSALDTIRGNLNAEQPVFESMFAAAAADIPILTDGLDSLVDNALPGLNNMVGASQPIMRGLASVMGDVGSALSSIANDIAGNSGIVGSDLQSMGTDFKYIGDAIGNLIVLSSDLFQAFSPIITLFSAGVDVISKGFKAVGSFFAGEDITSKIKEQAAALQTIPAAIEPSIPVYTNAATNAKTLADDIVQIGSDSATASSQISGLQDAVKTLSDSGFEKADDFAATFYNTLNSLVSQLPNATGKILDLNGGLDLTSARGRDVLTAVEGARNSMIGMAQSMADAGAPSDEIAGKLGSMGAAFEDAMRKAGLTDAQIKTLEQTYQLMPSQIATDVTAPGAVTSTDQISALLGQVGQIPVGKSITVSALTGQAMSMLKDLGFTVTTLPNGQVTITAQTAQAAKDVQNFIDAEQGRTIFVPIKGVPSPVTGLPLLGPYHVQATGGPTRLPHYAGGGATTPLIMNEEGPEVVKLPTGSTVLPTANLAAEVHSAAQAFGGGGGSSTLTFAGNLDTAMATAIMRMVRAGDIQLTVNGQRVKVG